MGNCDFEKEPRGQGTSLSKLTAAELRTWGVQLRSPHCFWQTSKLKLREIKSFNRAHLARGQFTSSSPLLLSLVHTHTHTHTHTHSERDGHTCIHLSASVSIYFYSISIQTANKRGKMKRRSLRFKFSPQEFKPRVGMAKWQPQTWFWDDLLGVRTWEPGRCDKDLNENASLTY